LRAAVLVASAACAAGAGIGVWHWRVEQLPAAERALAEGNFGKARFHLDRCLSWSPNDPDVLALTARLERVDGHIDAAAVLLERCQSRHGISSLAALESSLLRVQSGDLSEETPLIQRLTTADAETPWILEALARGHLQASHWPTAMLYLDGWLKLQPDCVRAHELHGRTLERLTSMTKAMKSYERALELDPSRLQARLRLAGLLLDGQRLVDATPHLEILERDHFDHPDACVLVGRYHVFRSKSDRARQCFEAALRSDPNHVPAMIHLGKLYLQLDRPDEAERLLARAHQAFPFDKYVHFTLAECYVRLGDTSGKAEYHRRRHAEIVRHSKQLDELLSKKLPAAPKDPALLAAAGVHYFAVGQDQLARHFLYSALRVDGRCAPAHIALADYFDRVGQGKRAAFHRVQAKLGRDNDPKVSTVSSGP
jgi:Tfp pilus assembly protein PilF